MDRRKLWTIGIPIAAAAAVLVLGRCLASAPAQKRSKAIPSPRVTELPHLNEDAIALLPYPPDLLPGARDIDTPYGSMRVYEWGPESGRKIVMIPGDTTPAPIFAVVATELVKAGCRVIVLDTWGRGYSDAPLGVAYTSELFMFQVLFAISSSKLAWTGEESGGFSLIGFSHGGSISMSFASAFPGLVNSVVLLAPGGFVQVLPEGYTSVLFRFPFHVPLRYLRAQVAAILGTSTNYFLASEPARGKVTVDTLDLPALWQWQYDHHQGFVHAFVETVRNNPFQHQSEQWRRACEVICTKRESGGADRKSRLQDSRLLVVCGEDDPIVFEREIRPALEALMPDKERLVFRTVPGDHGFPLPSGKEVARLIAEFWDLDA